MNIEYHTVSGVIERIVTDYIYVKKVRIPDMDAFDIAQEIRMKCVQALDNYNPNKSNGSPFHFLHRSIHNHIYNLKRGVWTVNNPPCARCECWDKQSKQCIKHNECEKMGKYREAMRVKASLRTPIGFEKDCTDNQSVVFDSIEELELYDLIKNRLPMALYDDYMVIMKGGKIDLKNKNLLRRTIINILKEEL